MNGLFGVFVGRWWWWWWWWWWWCGVVWLALLELSACLDTCKGRCGPDAFRTFLAFLEQEAARGAADRGFACLQAPELTPKKNAPTPSPPAPAPAPALPCVSPWAWGNPDKKRGGGSAASVRGRAWRGPPPFGPGGPPR